MARKKISAEQLGEGSRHARLAGMQKIAARYGQFKPAKEVLKRVRAVPTRLIQLDHALRVGGFPIERFCVVHGPSGDGKTKLALALLCSFLALDNFAVLIDAERTTTIDWTNMLFGDLAAHPYFLAHRPSTYEDTVDRVRGFVKQLAEDRAKGVVPKETTALIVVDSIRKLVPEDIFAKIARDGASGAKGSVDGMGGRGAQIKAAMNAAWLDELTPLLDDTSTAMIAIARETDDPNADIWDRRKGEDFKVGGGKSLIYDSSLVIRVELDGYVTHGDGKEKKFYGERHLLTVRKTKVAGKENKQALCWYHSSNGTLVPEGFDTARDLVEFGEKCGVLKRAGAAVSFGRKRWPSRNAAVKALSADPAMLRELDKACRAKFADVAPLEIDEDGVVQDAPTNGVASRAVPAPFVVPGLVE